MRPAPQRDLQMQLSWFWFTVFALAVWRVTHLLAAEDGPGAVIARWRAAAGNGFWGALLDCFYCLSLWVALPFAWALGTGWGERAVLWLALSGAACLAERAGTRAEPPALYFEGEEEDSHALLRRSTQRNDPHHP
jgi:hypothetical protein